jgi:GH24 family phage-related lysozyme (muramidase)
MTRRINAEGLSLIKKWEGRKLTAYRDVVGVLTIGYGSTGSHVKLGMTITEAEAEALLRKDLSRFEERVSRLVKVPLTDNQFAALVSFDFNTGAIDKSTLLKKLNKGDYNAVPSELMKWVNAGGKRVQGLVNRRAAEAGLWAKGEFVASNFVDVQKRVPTNEVAAIGGGGAAAVATTASPAIPEVLDAITGQQQELSSGDWIRMTIAAVILGLTIWGVYQKVKN